MTVRIISAGAFTTVQDLGRKGFAAVGVAPSGAFDRSAMRLANRLVGNAEDAAVLENLGGGLILRFDRDVEAAVTGAHGEIAVAGRPAARNALIRLHPADTLVLGPPTRGLRSYVAVRGGIAVEPVLGSRSWDSLGRLGPPPLTPGAALPIGADIVRAPLVDCAPVAANELTEVSLRLWPGPRADWFTTEAVGLLASGAYRVSPASDRVGLRMVGPPLRRAPLGESRELPPEGLVRGAVEVPPDGQPIILGPDHPTTGGYPVIGVVHDEDTDQCGQLVPGQTVRFIPLR